MLLRILLILLLTSSPAWATNFCNDGNNQGCWEFTEGSGETIADSSVNTSNTGTFLGSGEPAWAAMAGTNAPSYAQYLTDFDGSNDIITFGDLTILDSATAWTILLWVKLDTQGTSERMVAKWGSTSGTQDYVIGLDDSASDEIITAHRTVTNSANVEISTNANLTTAIWYHIAWVGNSDVANYLIYKNGATLSTTTAADNVGAIRGSNQGVSFGADSVPSNYLDASMTEVAIFDRTLTITEINDIMNFGLAPSASTQTGITFYGGNISFY